MKIFQYTTQFNANTTYLMYTQISSGICLVMNILPQRFTINIFFDNADTIIIFSNILFNIINNGDMGMFQILNKMGLLHEPSGILLVTRKTPLTWRSTSNAAPPL